MIPRLSLLAALLVVLGPVAAPAAESVWTTDLPAARQRASAERKHLLLDFTGSDWCGWCIKMKRETLSKKAFLEYAAKNLVLVELDFPERKRQSEAVRKANEAHRVHFKVESYPTLILLDPDGKELGRTEYVAGGPDAFMARLEGFKTRGAAEKP